MKTQNQMLMSHLSRRVWITAGEALSMYGIARLAARALELGLISEPISTRNKFGQKVKISRYRLPAKG